MLGNQEPWFHAERAGETAKGKFRRSKEKGLWPRHGWPKLGVRLRPVYESLTRFRKLLENGTK